MDANFCVGKNDFFFLFIIFGDYTVIHAYESSIKKKKAFTQKSVYGIIMLRAGPVI